jgi:hypothetical protein
VAAEKHIDLLKIRENGSADWVGRVGTVAEAQPKLDQLSAFCDNHFLAIERASGTIVAHVMGKLPR